MASRPCLVSLLRAACLAPLALPAYADKDRVIDASGVTAIQDEPEDPVKGRYDWGPCVMRDDGLYKMWWVRLGGDRTKRFPYTATLPDGSRHAFTYPDWGDRIYYAESRDGRAWRLGGEDYRGDPAAFGPDAEGPLRVFAPAERAGERNHVACPSVIRVGPAYYMYYEAPSDIAVDRGPDGQAKVGGEFHAQVFVATSEDGKRWRRHPADGDPRPIVAAPEENRKPDHRRYGLGQPSVFRQGGRFVMHYVDSCTGPGDFIVRLEADNPWFRGARASERALAPAAGGKGVPAGAVARFAQMDVKPLGGLVCLLRPAYGTGRMGLLVSRTGVFREDADAADPGRVFPQIRAEDPRGPEWRERWFPRFLTDAEGRIAVEGGNVVLFYSAGRGFKEQAHTWDLRRAEVPASALR